MIIYRQEHADQYGEAEESPSTIEQIKRHFYYVEKNKAGGLIPKIKKQDQPGSGTQRNRQSGGKVGQALAAGTDLRCRKDWRIPIFSEKYRTAGTGVFEPMQGSGYYRKPERDVCVQ